MTKQEVEMKLAEECSELLVRLLQVNQGRDKQTEVLLELGDVLAWAEIYKNHPDIDKKLINSFVKKKLKSIKSKI